VLSGGTVKRAPLIAVAIALMTAANAGTDNKSVTGFGGFPVSSSMTSMWLGGPDGRPLLMAYFNGPEGWHKTQWKIASAFKKGSPGWAEFRSEKATLRLWLNPETGDAEVQSDKFNLAISNTFLVLHTGETAVSPNIVPLGTFDLPKSGDQPAAILLLKENPALAERIKKQLTGS
jgi:hypothetical protein